MAGQGTIIIYCVSCQIESSAKLLVEGVCKMATTMQMTLKEVKEFCVVTEKPNEGNRNNESKFVIFKS